MRGGSRSRALLLALTAVLAGLVLLAWSQPWFTLTLTPASGDGHPLVVGGDVAAGALAPLALTTLALIAALAISGPVFRTILGVLEALVGGSIVTVAIVAITDPAGASSTAITQVTGQAGHESVHALVESVEQAVWPALAIVFGALLVLVGVAIAITGSRWPVSGRRYSRTRTQPVGPGAASDGAPRETDAVAEWDALSEGDDPTDASR